MTELIASLIFAALLASPLLFFCAFGPLADRVHDRRLAGRRRVVAPYRPIRLAQWTGYGWREVVPGGAW